MYNASAMILRCRAYVVCVTAVAAMLAACSSSSPPNSAFSPGATDAVSDTYVTMKPFAIHPNHRKSWVSPDARRAPRLLFVSDSGTNAVYIFSLPSMMLKGTLTGFREPQGLCADAKGNIWITNTGTHQIFQYSRTGRYLKTLNDPYGYPVGCAVDWSSGDLAVTDVTDFTSHGDVLIYADASGTPARRRCPGLYHYYFDGYGPRGTLWVSGRSTFGRYVVCGGAPSRLSQITLSRGTIYFPGAIQWDGASRTWVAFDQFCNNTTGACSYPVSASGSLGTPTTYSTRSGGAICDLVQAVVGANGFKFVGGGDYEYCGFGSSTADRWAYPAGGTPTAANVTAGLAAPTGAAISTK
jgi:hypothetical protein